MNATMYIVLTAAGSLFFLTGLLFATVGFKERRRVTHSRFGLKLMNLFINNKPGELVKVGFLLISIGALALAPSAWRIFFP